MGKTRDLFQPPSQVLLGLPKLPVLRAGLLVCRGVLQAKRVEWVAFPLSRGSSQPRDQTRVSCISYTGRQILRAWRPDFPGAAREAP